MICSHTTAGFTRGFCPRRGLRELSPLSVLKCWDLNRLRYKYPQIWPNIFREILDKSSKYLQKFSKYLQKFSKYLKISQKLRWRILVSKSQRRQRLSRHSFDFLLCSLSVSNCRTEDLQWNATCNDVMCCVFQ